MTGRDRERIADAIAKAERGTTGRIAVRIVPDKNVEAFERAKQEFGHTGLHRHAQRNAALILVAPKARRYAVIGDTALHERVGDGFWNEVVAGMQPLFERGDAAGAIVGAVSHIGSALREHFPSAEA
jgi:uncharacterized membrane protein